MLKFSRALFRFWLVYSLLYLFVAILENGCHLEFSIGQSDRMDLITIEMSHTNCGACLTICMAHPKNANYLLHSTALQPTPTEMLQHAPMANVISPTKFVIVEKYGVGLPYMESPLNLATNIQGPLL